MNKTQSYQCFPGAPSIDFIHYVKPTLQNPENQFEAAILHKDINDPLKLGFDIDFATNIMNVANE